MSNHTDKGSLLESKPNSKSSAAKDLVSKTLGKDRANPIPNP
jgi:hypothetical protein